MVVKSQPVFSWLLDGNPSDYVGKIIPATTPNTLHLHYLINGLRLLSDIQKSTPEWGLPELVMSSFEKVMKESAKSFYKFDHQLFQDFYRHNECGILISSHWGTIVYGFSENRLHVWLFATHEGFSKLYLYFNVESTENNTRRIYSNRTITDDDHLFFGDTNARKKVYDCLSNFLISYLAVKRRGKVDVIVIPPEKTTKLDDTIFPYKPKEKIRNNSGQEVIVMDSRWFRKIVNDNEIFVRGFFKYQNKKDAEGEWYKELIFIRPYVRHGYHRSAKIEDDKQS